MFEIYKSPNFENDSYFFSIRNLTIKNIDNILKNDNYLRLKYNKFKNLDISKMGFDNFYEDRPSLRFLDKVPSLNGSIYTYTVSLRNDMFIGYKYIINQIKQQLEKTPNSRKLVLRFANKITEYFIAENKGNLDVSCLNLIQYFGNDITLIFRSSDIKNELFVDIITIYEFFIKPIYNIKEINLNIFATTSQNVDYFSKFLNKFNKEVLI